MSEKPSKVIIEKTIGFKLPNTEKKFRVNDCILYALGIGFSKDPLLKKDLNFTYELGETFKVFPTYVTSLFDIGDITETMASCPGLPEINPLDILHGIHTLTLHRKLKAEGVYYNTTFVEDIQDKEKGALMVIKMESFEEPEKKTLAITNKMSLFIRGIGGFDPKKSHKPIVNLDIPPAEKRKPDIINEQTTVENQALLFRLNGDFNPLHADPQMAKLAGFHRPILPGLCTYGITAKLVIDKISAYDVDSVQTVHTRFVSHVFPGETILLNGWFAKDQSAVVFEALCKERNKVIANGVIQMRKEFKPKL